jgi:CRISPR-associated endonuclease/helicase Cas3
MRQASGDMYVFTPQTEFIKRTPKYIEQTAAVAEATLREYAEDPTAIAAIEAYYSTLYTLHNERSFDEMSIVDHFEKGAGQLNFDFKSAAEKFKLIDESSVTVLIPYDEEARRQIDALQYANYPAAILRRLQSYAVNIYEREFTALQSKGAIQTIADNYHALDSSRMDDYYDPRTGLVIPERSGGDALFFD